jgi:hypothetical protein
MKKLFLFAICLLLVLFLKAQTNTNLGFDAGYSGSYNTNIGYMAGDTTTAGGNTFVGAYTGSVNTAGTNNTFSGTFSGRNNTIGGYNTFYGSSSGTNNTKGSYNNFLGQSAGTANTEGNNNNFLGSKAGYSNTLGSVNNFVGYMSGYANTTGNNNNFVGPYAGYLNTTGSNNSFFGYQAGYLNNTGSNNVFLGSNAGYNEKGSNKLYIDNSNTTTPLIYGDFSTDVVNINGKLGIGTPAAPDASLTVYGTSNFYPNMVGAADARLLSIKSTLSNPAFSDNNFPVVLATGGGNQPLILDAARVGIGTANPKYKLDVAGSIRANEIKVNTTGADFVFAPNYKLRPLSEVESFIKQNLHLPEIATAAEMQNDGVNLSEMQTKLLQKVEELTLYIIKQEATIQQQNIQLQKIVELEKELKLIKTLLVKE